MVKRIFISCLSVGVAVSLAPLAGFPELRGPQARAAEVSGAAPGAAPAHPAEPVIPDRPEPAVPHPDDPSVKTPPGALLAPAEGAPLPAQIRDVLVKLHASALETVALANTASARSSRPEVKDFAMSLRQGRLDLDKQLMVLLHEWDVPQTAIVTPAESLVTAFLHAPDNSRLFRGKALGFDGDFLAKAASMQTDDIDQIQRLLAAMTNDAKNAHLTKWLREAEAQAKEKRTEAESLRAPTPEKDRGKS